MKIKLWIDDVRPAPRGWRRAKTSNEAIDMLCNYDPTEISFDHDLGGNDTSMNIVNMIEKWSSEDRIGRFVWHIHSANPVGRKNLELALQSCERFWDQNDKTVSTK